MSKRVVFIYEKNQLIILLKPERKKAMILATVLCGIFFVSVSIWFIKMIFESTIENNFFIVLFAVLYCLVLFFAGKNIIINDMMKERLEITQEKIRIIKDCFFYIYTLAFFIDDIVGIGFAWFHGTNQYAKSKKNIDFLNLHDSEKIITSFVGDGKFAFEYYNYIVQFGKNLPSWNAELIFDELNKFLIKKLKIKVEKPIEYFEEEFQIPKKNDSCDDDWQL